MNQYIEDAANYGANNYSPLPVVLTEGKGVWVWDNDGNKYMDMLAGYSAVNQGHCHPDIIKAAKNQMDRLTLTSRAFQNDQMGELLKKICNLSSFEKALPMNTGAEAVETALKAARKWGEKVKGIPKNQAEIIVCENNFHGRTITIISFSTEDQYKDGFGALTPGFKAIPYGDVESLKAAINENTVAFLVEPIQGEGGVIIPPEGYLKDIRTITEKNNVLLMLDEIQTGLGRTGKLFTYQYEGIKPDVLILGKALGGGVYPVSVMLSDKEIMDVFNPGDHGSTFGGNPLGSAVGIAALDVLTKYRLPQKAEKDGKKFVSFLESIIDEAPCIREIRAKGMMIGVEIKEEYGNARKYCEAFMNEGLLCKETHEHTIRFTPPLVITDEELEWAFIKIKKVLTRD
jgi:ornithine--oxo-acid transaminase